MNNMRQAALTLHRLEAGDRDWLMQQLSPEHQQELAKLIGELREIGVSAFDAEATLLNAKSMATGAEPNLAFLNGCSVGEVFPVLLKEPDSIVGLVLNSHPWTWRTGVLAELKRIGREERVKRAMESSTTTPRFQRAVVEKLACALRQDTRNLPDMPREGERNWLNQMKSVMGSWLL